jgi:hypothetical protein
MSDQTPVEPYSPTFYERTFLEGADCWGDASCAELSTDNDLIKENLLMTIDVDFRKDFRWIDLGLPDPSEVPEGEPAVNPGEPRWAFIGRSWQDRSLAGRNDNAWVHQSYTVEVWIPDGGETLRMLCLWSETELDGLNFTDEQVIATTRSGIDRNFQAVDAFLE